MKSKLFNILAAVQAAAALLVLGAIKLFAPVCGKMLTLENGNEVHMKCFYTAQAAVAVCVILLVAAVVTILSKVDYKKVQLVSITGGILLFLLFTSLIGVCANPDMACNGTAVWAKIGAAVTVLCGVASFFGGKDGQIPD